MHNENDYRKLAIVGHIGSGKSRLIHTLSEIDPVESDVKSSVDIGKEMTTVGIDYGRIKLSNNDVLGLYGVPGQERFSFIWKMVSESIWGLVLLIKYSDNPDIDNFEQWLSFFNVKEKSLPCLIGISHCEEVNQENISSLMITLQDILQNNGIIAPIIPIDTRDKSQGITLLNTLNTMANI